MRGMVEAAHTLPEVRLARQDVDGSNLCSHETDQPVDHDSVRVTFYGGRDAWGHVKARRTAPTAPLWQVG